MTALELLARPELAPWLGPDPLCLSTGPLTAYYLNERRAPAGLTVIYATLTVIEGSSTDYGNIADASKLLIYSLYDPTQREAWNQGLELDRGPITDLWNTLKRRDAGSNLLSLITADLSGERLMLGGAELEASAEPEVDESSGVLVAQVRARVRLWR